MRRWPAHARTVCRSQAGATTIYPTFDGQPLPLDRYESSRSLAIHPEGDRFVLGTDWSLRAFDAKGTPLWTRAVPSIVWAVNITGDGRLVVAAYGDGTIRWHRMSDGVELLAFMPLADRTNWVAWTPEGFYAATPGRARHPALARQPRLGRAGRQHRRRGHPRLVPARRVAAGAAGAGNAARARAGRAGRAQPGGRDPHQQPGPAGAQLHLLAIGISAYNEDYAKHLRLNYADRDARDLASAIVNTQDSLYAAVKPQVLHDKDANKAGILRALADDAGGMERGRRRPRGGAFLRPWRAWSDGKLYLLPVEVDAPRQRRHQGDGAVDRRVQGRAAGTRQARPGAGAARCLPLGCDDDGRGRAGHGLDCAAHRPRRGQRHRAHLLQRRRGLARGPAWRHGAFTKVLLDALSDAAADTDRNGLINPTGLADYVFTRVSSLTAGAQTPGMEIRFNTTVFASAL